MKKRQGKSKSGSRKVGERYAVEEQATRVFYAGLQKAIDGVDWRTVELPKLRDRKRS